MNILDSNVFCTVTAVTATRCALTLPSLRISADAGTAPESDPACSAAASFPAVPRGRSSSLELTTRLPCSANSRDFRPFRRHGFDVSFGLKPVFGAHGRPG